MTMITHKILNISARPSIEGPPSCEAIARASMFNLHSQWNHITVLFFLYFHILDSLKGQSFISHVSSLMSQVLFDGLLYTKNQRIALHPPCPLDLGWPQNHHENSSISEPVSKARKAMKIGHKAVCKHEKSTLESQGI